MTLKMMMGCALAIGGFCIYSHARMYAKAQAPHSSAADLEAAQQKVTAHAAQPLPRSLPMCLPLWHVRDAAAGAISTCTSKRRRCACVQ